ncbi:hybrid sensor histidine kinase/response regulator [uncultured Clostridium sp.]|uniref:hybrid sensor histidine kinase/response regulator n=1 Tax=uncultured Clostridium sp. TaxID=59620 RepID=UPI0028F11D37|nr:hybrid sensor histidine kinase/response regulator [uncultured Clostridium sp.]
MNNEDKRVIVNKKIKNSIYISTDSFNINKVPNSIKDNICKNLLKKERVIIFTDELLYKDLEKIFLSSYDLVIDSINSGKLDIKLYDSLNFNVNSIELLEVLKYTAKTKDRVTILWDFRNYARRIGDLEELIKCVSNIISYSNSKVKNIIFINNYKYNVNSLKELCSILDIIIIFDKNKELYFQCDKEMDNILWLLNSNAELKYQNNNLVLFNDIYSNVPKTLDKETFKNIIINNLKDVCDIDFCIIYTLDKVKENIVGLDSSFGVTKRHKYYMINNRKFISFQRSINEEIINKGHSLFIDISQANNTGMEKVVKEISISSCLGVYVDNYENIKGVIWVGRYERDKKILKEDINYIGPLCKTMFHLIYEQNKYCELQDKFVENEKLRAMGEMAAGIAHDINNVLTPIVGSIQLLRDSNIEDKNIMKHLKIIEICAYDGMNIADKVNRFTRKSIKNKLELFVIDDILTDAIDLTKNKWLIESNLNGVYIEVIFNLKSKTKVKGNATELREVFVNIIRNAIDSIEGEGKIEIITQEINNMVCIKIKDNGMGMSEKVIKRVFEPFFTTKGNKGSGLGLSLSYKIIQEHGGKIKIDSKEKVGTCFNISLPICNDMDLIKEEIYEDKIEFNGNILIIDDQSQIRSVISDMIKSIVDCRIKSCGNENIEEELKRRKYDIIICDFSMPGMNGVQISNISKNINKDVFFCLMTGWLGNFDINMTENVDLVLTKPIDKEKLKEIFMKYKSKITT